MSDVGDITVPISAPDGDRFREIATEEIGRALERAKERYIVGAEVSLELDRESGGRELYDDSEE